MATLYTSNLETVKEATVNLDTWCIGVHPKSKRGFLGRVVLLNLIKFSEDHSVPSE